MQKLAGGFVSIFNFIKNKEQKVIIGIISSKGSSGGRGQGQELWNFSFNFDYCFLKNDIWLEDDEKEMSELKFQSSMSLESLVLYTDDSYTFWYNDGDLFGGHVIIVEGNLDDGLIRAEIAG